MPSECGMKHVLVVHLTGSEALKLGPLHDDRVCYMHGVQSFFPHDVIAELSKAKTHAEEKTILQSYQPKTVASCERYGECVAGDPDMDLAGPHCDDHSTAGKSLGREGQSSKFFLMYCRRVIELEIPILVLENVCTGEFTELVSYPEFMYNMCVFTRNFIKIMHTNARPIWCCTSVCVYIYTHIYIYIHIMLQLCAWA